MTSIAQDGNAAVESIVEVEFELNGENVSAQVDGKRSLMRYLRDDLGLMGTKDGCSSGDCGSCVVLVDGKPQDACVFLMRRAGGTKIETIDGLAQADGTLHPIQAAFLDRGAVQCGFCIPGMIMSTKALLDEDPKPDRGRDPRGPEGEHLPLHRLHADLRRGREGVGVARERGTL